MRRLSELSKAGRTPRGADSPRPAAVDPPAHAVADQTLPAAADAAPTLAMPRQGGAAPRAAGERGVGFDETIVAPEPTGASPRPSWDAVRFGAVALGSYAVQGELARGGLGRILRAHDARLDRPVALKELLTGGGGLEERFVREAMLTARLQHPSIVPIYEAGRWPTGEPFYAMKLVSGRSLADVIDGTPELDERLALLPHALSVAEAIAYAHSERIIHRDLKPGNVLIGPFGETVVIDWGLAKDLCLEDEEPAAEAAPQGARASRVSGPGLTMVGSVVGTPAYMPPEQAAGRRVDERADVYALGAILYHMLAGVAPYSAEDPFEIVKQVLSGPPVPLERVQPCVPRDLVTIVNKAMAREPSERYPTARELAEDLRRFQTGQIVGAHHYSARELLSRFFRRYRAQLSVLGGALLVLAAVGSLSVWRVIEARRAAEEALLHATKERDRAEAAQRRAIERADMLTLFEADAAAKRDPNASIAWLKTLSPAFERFRAARAVASDARSQGISLVLRGHTAVINSAVFSPDGRTLATAGDDRTVRLWDVATGRARVLSGHTDEVWRVAFSPDGHLLASGGKDRTIRVWDLATGESSVLAGHAAPVAALAFSRDGRRLVSRGRGERVWLWDVARGEGAALLGPPCDDEKVDFSADGSRVVFAAKGELTLVDVATGAARSFPGQDSPSTDLAISPDGARVATGDGEGVVRLWSLKTGAARELRGHEGTIRSLAFGPGGGRLVSGGRDRTVRVWDVATGSMRVLSGHEGVVYSVAVSPDGAAILSGGADHLPRLWDAQGGGSRVLRGFDDGAAWVGFSPDGGTAAIASYDQTVRLFRLSEHPDRLLLRGRAAARVALISPDSRRVASAGDDGVVRTASLDTGVVRALGGHEGPIHDLCFAPSGAVIASAGEDGTVRLWLGDVGVMRVLRGHEGAVLRVACAPDGRQLASAGRDGAVRLFSLEGGEGKVLYRHEGVVRALAFSPDGKRLASGGGDRAVMEWDLAEGRARVLRGHEGDVAAVAFSPDGEVLASGAKDHTIRLWDPGTGELRRTLDASGNGVERLLFFADGSRFATLGGEANARIWETASGKLLSVLRGHNGVVLGLAVAPGGDRVATSGRDGTVRIWDLVGDVSRVLTGHTAEVGWLSFSAGGQSLVSASADGTTRFWSDELPVSGPGLRAFFEEATPDTIDLGRPGGDSDIARRLRSP